MRDRFHIRNRYFLFIDLGLITLSVILSFFFRLELSQVYYDYLPTIAWMLGVSLILKPLIFHRFGLYRRFWAYASTREAVMITLAVSLSSVLVGGILLAMDNWNVFEYFSRSVPVIDWMLSLILIGGARFAPRVAAERGVSSRTAKGVRQVLIVGAGDAGALVVRELQKNPQLNQRPAAFLDDDLDKQNFQIHGVPVVGTLDDLAEQIEIGLIDEVVIAIPSAPGQLVRKVAEVCRQKGIPSRTMPGIYELLGGSVSVNRLREVDITDLLRREPTYIDNQRVGQSLSGKRVLVTGAGGSIASELCRQAARWGPAELVLLGHGENSIFEILIELEDSYPSLPLHPVICNIRDGGRLDSVFERFKPEIVFHAAAHKHVFLMEKNAEEAVTNNIMGTRNITEAAHTHGVERLIMISTDKAVRPTSIYGATKRIAEMIILDAAEKENKAYSVVRFGNVLGSRGSVVPLFKRQIAAGGPVTITHKDMERYFMTIPEAVHLVLQAFAMGKGGEVFLLNMGEPVNILNLAQDLIRLSGLEPGRDIEIVFTGIKAGEKLSEELWDPGASYIDTDHPEITCLDDEEMLHGQELAQALDALVSAANLGEVDKIVDILDSITPGSNIRETPPPDITSVV